jgi:glycosyltransferase involved in cell wall biosynthesis
MRKQSLAVVVPAYNEADHIRDCINAILHQGDLVDEILIVDNNSTDETAAIVHAFKSPKIRYLVERRQGVVHARNAGFDAVSTDLIGRIDADTRVHDGWAQAIHAHFDDTDSFAAAGVTHIYDSPFASLHRLIIKRQVKRLRNATNPQVSAAVGANMAIRTSAWMSVRPHLSDRTDIHEDLDLSFCLRKIGHTISHLPTMQASASARRGVTPPRKYLRYNDASRAVIEHHGLMNRRLSLMITVDSILHALLWPAYKVFAPVKARDLPIR